MSIEYRNREEYFKTLANEIRAEARVQDDEKLEEEIFVERMLEYLNDSNFTENATPCRHKGRGLKVDAYDINSTQNAIDIIVSFYDNDQDKIFKVGKPDVDKSIKWAKSFLKKSRLGTGLHEKLEDSLEAFDLAKLINQNYKSLKRSRIILLTNGVTGAIPATKEILGNFEITIQVYDFERLWRNISSGMKKEYITVDFKDEGYTPVKCVDAYDGRGIYTTYISLIPGQLLMDLYDRYGTRLLERNVRAFLQARSNVNRGIRDTIIERPNMFLAYNNGITVTANKVEIMEDENKNKSVVRISDFQVVNGGQTVASLWHTAVKNKASLKNVFLQMKLTVINKAELIDEIAPLISKYSNAQNKVNTADFSANDPFHRELEAIAFSIYAPDPTGGNLQTKWFYERARGNFAETRARERTPARIRAWDHIHPRKQRFDKLVVAKLENTWIKKPHIVSLGGQKNFSHFTVYVTERIADQNQIEITPQYFRDLIAKFIIWKNTEKIINAQKMPGYRANIVTYSLCWILHNHSNAIDLKTVWNKQAIDNRLESLINIVTQHIRMIITNTQGNVTEWCKKEELWRKIKNKKIDINSPVRNVQNQPIQDTKTERRDITWDDLISLPIWKSLVNWIENEEKLSVKDLEFSRGIVCAIEKNGAPTMPQMKISGKILFAAREAGFNQ
ncbi:MAG: AIPR family protein [Bacteroidetes bacterium]|nr:AIPR family protein [Bacteroidota bacterium]